MEIAIAILGSGALSAIIAGIFGLIQSHQHKGNGIRKGVRQLLYDRIKNLGRTYMSAGTISPEDLEDLIVMHRIYHNDLEGNGYLDSVMDAVKKLPTR